MGRKAIAFRGTTQIYCINSTLCQVRDIIDPIPSSNNAEKRISLPLLLQLMSSGANFSMVCARVLSVWTTPPWTRCNIYFSPSSPDILVNSITKNQQCQYPGNNKSIPFSAWIT